MASTIEFTLPSGKRVFVGEHTAKALAVGEIAEQGLVSDPDRTFGEQAARGWQEMSPEERSFSLRAVGG